MPNVKIFVDHKLLDQRQSQMDAALLPLRDALCAILDVDKSACQLAIISVRGLPDQPQANMEIHYLPTADRSREKIAAACQTYKSIIESALATPIAVRATALDNATYVALK